MNIRLYLEAKLPLGIMRPKLANHVLVYENVDQS